MLLLASALARADIADAGFGPTIGNGLAGIAICGKSKPPSIVINHTLAVGETHGVLHHFWATGAAGKIDRFWVDYYIGARYDQLLCLLVLLTSSLAGRWRD